MKKFKQLVLVEFRNSAPGIYEIESDKKIDIDKVAKYFIDKEDFNEDRDSLTFVDEPTKITL